MTRTAVTSFERGLCDGFRGRQNTIQQPCPIYDAANTIGDKLIADNPRYFKLLTGTDQEILELYEGRFDNNA